MQPPIDPIVLGPDWVPPVLLGRAAELERLEACFAEAAEASSSAVAVEAAPGGGSSVVARFAARRLVDRWGPPERRPRLVIARTRQRAGAAGVAADLLRHFDPGFHERGFSTAEILAGFLRRSLREDRSVIVLLDDVGPGGPDLAPLVKALLEPDRFLPEGVTGRPRIRLLLAAARTVPAHAARWRELLPAASVIPLVDLPALALRAIVIDRVGRALGSVPSERWVAEIVHRALEDGRGPARAIELVRRRLLPAAAPPGPARSTAPPADLGGRVVEAVRAACAAGPADLKLVRACEVRLARTRGERPLATTTFWRRIVRLEADGFLLRKVRAGGPGGSTSTVHLLRGAEPSSSEMPPKDTLRASGPSAPSWRAPEPWAWGSGPGSMRDLRPPVPYPSAGAPAGPVAVGPAPARPTRSS